MSDNRMKHLNNQLNKLKSQIEKFKPSDDVSKDQEDMERIEELIKDIETEIEEIDNEIEEDEDLKEKKPLLDKVSEQKNEFNIQKNNFNKKKDEARSAHSKELLMQGKLTGVERKKAQRDMAIDQVKEVDEQGLMLNSIHNNVKDANKNLENINVELKQQGEQIDRIGDKVITIDQSVKKTGQTMGEMERRNCCRKFILVFGTIILILVNIIMVFLILAKLFGWGPLFTKKVKGIEIKAEESFDFKKFKDDGYIFVMMKSGTGENKDGLFITKMNEAKKQEVEVGTYWDISATELIQATEQAQTAAEFLKDYRGELKYNIYLTIPNDILKDTSNTDTVCKNLIEQNIECGIKLSYENYKNYYKQKVANLGNIKHYWISDYNEEFDFDKEEKVLLWKMDSGSKYESKDVIRARKKIE